jgi:hypothetical protein
LAVLEKCSALALESIHLDFELGVTWDLAALVNDIVDWLANPSMSQTSKVGTLSSPKFVNLIESSVGEPVRKNFQLMVYGISLAYTQPVQHPLTASEIHQIGCIAGCEFLKVLDEALRPQSLKTYSIYDLRSLFLMIFGAILSVGYCQPALDEEAHGQVLEAQNMQYHLCQILAHYLIFLGSRLALPIPKGVEQFILEAAPSRWNKQGIFDWMTGYDEEDDLSELETESSTDSHMLFRESCDPFEFSQIIPHPSSSTVFETGLGPGQDMSSAVYSHGNHEGGPNINPLNFEIEDRWSVDFISGNEVSNADDYPTISYAASLLHSSTKFSFLENCCCNIISSEPNNFTLSSIPLLVPPKTSTAKEVSKFPFGVWDDAINDWRHLPSSPRMKAKNYSEIIPISINDALLSSHVACTYPREQKWECNDVTEICQNPHGRITSLFEPPHKTVEEHLPQFLEYLREMESKTPTLNWKALSCRHPNCTKIFRRDRDLEQHMKYKHPKWCGPAQNLNTGPEGSGTNQSILSDRHGNGLNCADAEIVPFYVCISSSMNISEG